METPAPDISQDANVEITELDGRRRRSLNNRARIVAAMLELIRAGEISPSAEQVASSAQVSLRTVFGHFENMESLYREMSSVIDAELKAAFLRPLSGNTWQERLEELIQRRILVYEKIAPLRRASMALRHGSRFLEADHLRVTAQQREILRRVLPAHVVADPLMFETLDLLLSYESLSRLRSEQNLSPAYTRDLLRTAAWRLIGI